MPLKETPAYRFWVDNNKDILAFDCGSLWFSKNTTVLTAAACAEQSLRPYICKHSMFCILLYRSSEIYLSLCSF
jgi:hypothetical protein